MEFGTVGGIIGVENAVRGMIPHRTFLIIGVFWFFGVSALLLGVPGFVPFVFRLAGSKGPSARGLKIAAIVGYMGIVFGCLAVIQLVFGSPD